MRIQALRHMDLSLMEVAALVENDGAGLQHFIEQQIAALERVMQNVERDLADWLVTLEMMAMYDIQIDRACEQLLSSLHSSRFRCRT